MESKDLKGIIPAIVTPFKEDSELDVDGLKRLTRYLLENGVHGIMTTGGNGEFPHLLGEEKRIVTETVVKEVKGNIPVIAGTVACSVKETLILSNDAKEAGADAVILTPPYYFRLPDESLFRFYDLLSQSLDIPIVVYNNPLYTGNNLNPRLIEKIADLKKVIGLKQSNADMGEFVETIRICAEKISLCTGIDSQFYPSLCIGGKGIFSTAACIIPKQMVQIYDLFQSGNHKEASALHMKIQPLSNLVEYDPGYVSPCKEALALLGIPGGPVREPMPRLNQAEKETLKNALTELGVL
jgi:4-hydroxy-tetrahydrodipicolinate synthase